MKRMSQRIVSKIEQNLRPLSCPKLTTKQNTGDMPIGLQKIDIQHVYSTIKDHAILDSKTRIEIITCLKSAKKIWQQYLSNPNKNGQLATTTQYKLKQSQSRLQKILSTLQIPTNSAQLHHQTSSALSPILQHLQKKSRKYKAHESQFQQRIGSSLQHQPQHDQEKDQEIKEEMADLVSRFKKYAVHISQNLETDQVIIREIGDNQEKQLGVLRKENSKIQDIIKSQKIGFFQLLFMGVVAIVLWVLGLAVIFIV